MNGKRCSGSDSKEMPEFEDNNYFGVVFTCEVCRMFPVKKLQMHLEKIQKDLMDQAKRIDDLLNSFDE